jgi:glycerol-3-phosphate acyltransferase PlsX
MKIIVDAFGGDNAPDEIISGSVKAVLNKTGFVVALAGKRDIIEGRLSKCEYDKNRIEILDADEIITNDDVPTDAIKNKKNSSLVVALDALRADDDAAGLVSAGSTGAVLAGGLLKIGRIAGISRPTLAPALPTLKGGSVIIADMGANVDCKPVMLCHFALLGVSYMQSTYGIKTPRVALISNGTEDKKGNELTKTAFAMLKSMPINFLGNMEAREILSGDFDVLVSDGFVGNVAFKAIEGAANAIFKQLKREMTSSARSKFGALLLKKGFKRLKKSMDYTEYGGSPFLGLNKLVIKSHGASKAHSIYQSIMQVYDMTKSGLIENIKDNIKNSEEILKALNPITAAGV